MRKDGTGRRRVAGRKSKAAAAAGKGCVSRAWKRGKWRGGVSVGEEGGTRRKDKTWGWEQEIAQSHCSEETGKTPVSSAPQPC